MYVFYINRNFYNCVIWLKVILRLSQQGTVYVIISRELVFDDD